MTVPLGRPGLIFWDGLGPGLGLSGPPAHFIVLNEKKQYFGLGSFSSDSNYHFVLID
jgi:hypothetical protein